MMSIPILSLVMTAIGMGFLALSIFIPQYKKSTRTDDQKEKLSIVSIALGGISTGVMIANLLVILLAQK